MRPAGPRAEAAAVETAQADGEARPCEEPRDEAPRRSNAVAHVQAGDSLLMAIQSLLYLIVIAMFIITLVVQPFRIPSGSMEPTLLIGDFLLADKQAPQASRFWGPLPKSAIHRGEVIVFHDPVDASMHLVKRVVGLPGDRLRMHGGHVFINGQALDEPYAVYRPGRSDDYRDNFPSLESADPDISSRWWIRLHTLVDHGELRVPEGSYFVLGDNRNDSQDSRYWGFVPVANIVGQPLLVYLSLRQPETGDGVPDGRWAQVWWRGGVLNVVRWNRTLHVIR